ncbi:MAG: general secretion pathway protein GspK [Leptospiraceae bacterium]|nr:general secretion pathway protein GspK [Leptospiraceae bacterium]MCP5494172.1 general secretion pathway protein GspK [Leptospiraceae bacterium]
MVIMLVMSIGVASFYTANQYMKDRLADYKIARSRAMGFKAFLLAQAGMHGALGALKKIPEEQLYQSGIAFNPPPIPVGEGMVYYRIIPEDGKFNLNNLVRTYDGSPNPRSIEMLARLLEQFNLKPALINPIIDFIDENNNMIGGGAEEFYYANLKPPRKIKNGPLYTLSELTSVKDFNVKLIYGSLKPDNFEEKKSQDFSTEEEKALITDSDYVLANNLTAYITVGDKVEDQININAAPYHVLMSLSEFMTRQAVMKILKLKIKKGGYIKELKDLEKEPEFQIKTTPTMSQNPIQDPNNPQNNQQLPPPPDPNQNQNENENDFTLYKELVGDGSELNKGRVKTKGDIYRIIGVGMIGHVTRKVSCIYDLQNKQMLFYSED